MIALVLIAGAIAPAICLSAGAGENARTIIADAASAATLASRGALVQACPAELQWTAEAAYDQCAVFRNYSDDAKKSFAQDAGITTDDACIAGLNAAGVKPVAAIGGK